MFFQAITIPQPPQTSELLDRAKTILGNPHVQELAQISSNIYLSNLGFLKVAAVLVSAFFIAATIYFAIKTGWLAVHIDRVQDVILKSNMPKKRSIRVWQTVQRHFYAGDENSLKLALLEADKILDEALRLAGFRGENLGERLKKLTEAQLPNLNDIWEAHKLRNRLAHETDFRLNRDTAERALAIYEQTFRDLGLLD